MSYGTIIAELGDGRYTLEIDLGEQYRLALVAASNFAVARYQLELIKAEDALAENEAAEAQMRQNIAQQVNNIIDIQEEDPDLLDAASQVAVKLYDMLYEQYAKILAANQPLRRTVQNLKIAITQAQKRLNTWLNYPTIQQRGAWCADYTLGASGPVGIIEINGESDLLLIKPGASVVYEGLLTPREFQSPEQAFDNTALLPGWQKFYPTYRSGVLTAINYAADTCTVDLDPATSSAQLLNINQTDTLQDVPIEYMTCNSAAFVEDDRVVVRFNGQDQSQPRVIGFLDNPKPCGNYACFRLVLEDVADTSSIPYLSTLFAFYPVNQDGADMFALAGSQAASLSASYRVNGGPWNNMVLAGTVGTSNAQWRNHPFPFPANTPLYELHVRNIGIFNYVPYESMFETLVIKDDPPGTVTEFRLMNGAEVMFNVAIETPDKSLGYIYDTSPEGQITYGGITGRVALRGGIDNSNTYYPNDALWGHTIERLDYTLFEQE